MYKTFELGWKAIYIIVFWSATFFILQTRKAGESFLDVGWWTLFGWFVLLAILMMFVIFIAYSHSSERQRVRNQITKGVIEDGMIFTVGGHNKFVPLLPEHRQLKSKVLLKLAESLPDDKKIIDLKLKSDAVRDLIETQEREEVEISEKATFVKNEGELDDLLAESGKPLNKAENQTKEKIKEEADEGLISIESLDNDDVSRSISKGVLFYEYQFNALYSYAINRKLHEYEHSIKIGKVVASNKERNEKITALKKEASEIRMAIDNTLERVVDCIGQFEYKGIVTTSPEIKSKRQLDLKDYQLLIFTALFPYLSWLDLRSNRAINSIEPHYLSKLSSAEASNLDRHELGLSLRDKRVLWNSRKMYDVYLNRDKDIAEKGFSSYNMPISFDENNNMFNPLEETVALCEFLRQALNTKSATHVVTEVVAQAPYNSNDIMRLVHALLTGKERFNSPNLQARVGIIKNGLIYLDMAAFTPKFNGMFAQRFPANANQNDYNTGMFMIYERLKTSGLLAMNILRDNMSKHVEMYDVKDQGELFIVNWDFGPKKNPKTFDNALIFHAAGLFKDVAHGVQELQANPSIYDISINMAVPLTPHVDRIQKQILATQKSANEAEKLMAELKPHLSDAGNNQAPVDTYQATVMPEIEPPETDLAPNTATAKQPILDSADQALAENLAELFSPLEANSTSLSKTNAILSKKDSYEDAEVYKDKEVQVIRLKRLTARDQPLDVRRRFAVNKTRYRDITFLECSNDAINAWGKDLNLTFFKILHEIRIGTSLNEHIKRSRDGKFYEIEGRNIPYLFNVYEQMAIFKMKGDSSAWHATRSEYRSHHDKKNSTYDEFDEISVIKCLKIFDSNEEQLYKKLEVDSWNAKRAQWLFDLTKARLLGMVDKWPALSITATSDRTWFNLPKKHLGRLNRVAVEINSFLAYKEQFKNDIKPELIVYANAITSHIIEKNGEVLIKLNYKEIDCGD